MSYSSLFHQFNLLFLEENEVHILSLEDIDVAMRKRGLVECTFVFIVVYQHQPFPESTANALDLLLIVVLHFSLTLILCNEIHQFMDLIRQFHYIENMSEMIAGDPSPHQVHDLVDVDVGAGSSYGLGLVLEVIQELQA